MYTEEKYTWKAWKPATKLSNPSREGLSTSLPPADSPSFLNHLLCVIISDFVATLESRSPFPFWSSFSRVRAVLFEGWTTKGVVGERRRATLNERTRKALFPLYEFNPALSRHGLLFQTRGRHSTMRRRRRYIKRRVLFCKCAPGNWSSCCSSFGFFVCHFNQDLHRKEVLEYSLCKQEIQGDCVECGGLLLGFFLKLCENRITMNYWWK